ncbi:oral-facial-digital syndrome 1 protein homolog isoform X2 [Electrophorus electricus]|nr:oral-facial-digital syndrome 1 protein homolog isoform X2 [Electrophorus electricus]
MIQELQPPLAHGTPAAATAQAHPVSVLASNSLVIDHLQSSGYEYTLSVFYPECGMSKDKVFSTRDLLQFMKLGPHSPLYKSLVSNTQNGQKGLLISLLSELIDHHIHERRDVDTQTSTAQSSAESLVRKLQLIDEEYEDLRQQGHRWSSVEAKLAAYRKEMEEQSQTELKVKVQHFQEVEMVRVRREEQDRCRQELLEITRTLERTYEQKAEALMNREKNAIERLQKQQEIEEKEIYNQRQALLKELEAVRNRENELRHQVEAFEKSCKDHEEKMRSLEEILRRRESTVKTMEDTYDQKLANELRKYQQELKDDYTRRTEKLTDDEKRNKEEMLRLQKETAVLDSKLEEFTQTASQLKRVQAELELARADVAKLRQQNAELREKLEDLGDHAALRKERRELHTHVHLLKEQLDEHQQEVQRLRRELSVPSQEVLALQTELRRLHTAHRLHQEELQSQQQVFHTQLTQEVERSAQMKSQLLECEERTRWMTAHTEELKRQLRHTQQALENEVFRKPRPSPVDCSVLHLSSDKVAPPDLYVEGSLLKARLGYDEGMFDPGLASRGQRPLWPRSGSPELGTERVAAALARIRELEKEAESLEEAYRTYQQRAAAAAVAHIPSGAPSRLYPATHHIRPAAPSPHAVTLNEPAIQSFYIDRELTNHRTTPRVGSPPPRRLSSTPVCASKSRPRAHVDQGAERRPGSSGGDGAAVTFASLSCGSVVSPIPTATAESSGDHTHITPPSSLQMKSTGQDHCRSPELQEVSTSSQESSPQPEKISIQDLTEPLPDLHCSSEQLQEPQWLVDLAHRPHSQRERDSAPDSQRERDGSLHLTCGEDTAARTREEDEDNDGEKSCREERRRKESGCREREEAQECGKGDLERVEQELLQQEALPESRGEAQCDGGPMKTNGDTAGPDVLKDSSLGGGENTGRDLTDPLHKYMMMVLQGRERDKEQSPKKEDSENQSPEPWLSEDKDNSIVSYSQEEADEFW